MRDSQKNCTWTLDTNVNGWWKNSCNLRSVSPEYTPEGDGWMCCPYCNGKVTFNITEDSLLNKDYKVLSIERNYEENVYGKSN